MTTFNTNIAALRVQRALSNNSSSLRLGFERLSTGLRINRASDDAAGLAIADGLRTDVRLYNQAGRNVNDGISMLNIMEGSLSEQSNILTRLIELAEQSSNGTISSTQRTSLNAEYQALLREFGRIGATAKFNGLSLLQGYRTNSTSSFTLQAGIDGSNLSELIMSAPDTATLSGVLDFGLADPGTLGAILSIDNLDEIETLFLGKVFQTQVVDSSGQTRDVIVALHSALGASNQLSYSVFLRGSENGAPTQEWSTEATLAASTNLLTDPETGLLYTQGSTFQSNLSFSSLGTTATLTIDLTALRFKYNGITLSFNATQDPSTLSDISAIDFTGVQSDSSALIALTVAKNRLTDLSKIRGQVGALSSRLQTAFGVLETTGENSASAESRIRDVDVAEQSASLVASQIRLQASSSVLAQAINQPSLLLSLLNNPNG